MVILQHEHILTLVDLNPKYPHDEEVYDDEEDLLLIQAFQCSCERCGQKITYLHRYYYKCDECDYSLHKLCAEPPTELEHSSHSAHTLTIFQDESQMQCRMCTSIPVYKQLGYHCSECMFNICLDCGMDEVQYHTIYHPSHRHPLTLIHKQREILAECDACLKEHKGVFYHCAICFSFSIHSDCVFRPKRFLIQDGTHGRFFHTHPLILAYSFSKMEQEAKCYPSCRVCDENSFSENGWIYKCNKCRYYVHLDCTNLRSNPANSDASTDYKDGPDVLHLPFTGSTYDIIKDFFLKEANETSITHDSHEHPLIRGNGGIITTMSKVQDICDGCVRPIFEGMSFYKCPYGCNFVLHEWCTRLPSEIKGPECHPEHTLVLLPKATFDPLGLFVCRLCFIECTGFAYSCTECENYEFDVSCAFLAKKFTHKSHPSHMLSVYQRRWKKDYCRLCLISFTSEKENSLSCGSCNFHLHPKCALLFPDTIRHKYDKHPMTLSYFPIENYDGDYFCEVCEEELNPNASFYHCHQCVQSMHTACAPLIPQSIADIYSSSLDQHATGYLEKMKFGSIHKTRHHEHPLSFMLATEHDHGPCSLCHDSYISVMLKCLQSVSKRWLSQYRGRIDRIWGSPNADEKHLLVLEAWLISISVLAPLSASVISCYIHCCYY